MIKEIRCSDISEITSAGSLLPKSEITPNISLAVKNCSLLLLLLTFVAVGCNSGKVSAPDVIKPSTFVVDSTDKFPAITDEALLTLVQKQTFK